MDELLEGLGGLIETAGLDQAPGKFDVAELLTRTERYRLTIFRYRLIATAVYAERFCQKEAGNPVTWRLSDRFTRQFDRVAPHDVANHRTRAELGDEQRRDGV